MNGYSRKGCLAVFLTSVEVLLEEHSKGRISQEDPECFGKIFTLTTVEFESFIEVGHLEIVAYGTLLALRGSLLEEMGWEVSNLRKKRYGTMASTCRSAPSILRGRRSSSRVLEFA
jgi:hypothetical protein